MPKRSPLDAFGDSAVRTRDDFGHITAALKAYLTPKQLKDTGVLLALDELQVSVSKDMQAQVENTWRNGVAHGEWLKEAERREMEDAARTLQRNYNALQTQNLTMQQQLWQAAAQIKALVPAQGVLPPQQLPAPSGPDAPTALDKDMELHLDDLIGDLMYLPMETGELEELKLSLS